MTFGLVHARYSLPEWQAEKLTFSAPCFRKVFLIIPFHFALFRSYQLFLKPKWALIQYLKAEWPFDSEAMRARGILF